MDEKLEFKKFKEKREEKRSLKQNRALHKFFKEVSDEMIAQGITVEAIIKHFNAIPNEKFVKSMFQGRCEQEVGKEHTSDLTKEEFSKVLNSFLDSLSNDLKMEVYFPDEEQRKLIEFYNNY